MKIWMINNMKKLNKLQHSYISMFSDCTLVIVLFFIIILLLCWCCHTFFSIFRSGSLWFCSTNLFASFLLLLGDNSLCSWCRWHRLRTRRCCNLHNTASLLHWLNTSWLIYFFAQRVKHGAEVRVNLLIHLCQLLGILILVGLLKYNQS